VSGRGVEAESSDLAGTKGETGRSCESDWGEDAKSEAVQTVTNPLVGNIDSRQLWTRELLRVGAAVER